MSTTTTKDDLMNSLMTTTTTMGSTTTNGFGNGGVGGGTDNEETHNIVSPPDTITEPAVGTEASTATGEEDLFGGIPIIETGVVVTGGEHQLLQSQPPPLPPTALPPPPPPPSAVSGLFGSLLIDNTSIAGASGGGGLFDDIDQAEEAAAQKAKEEAAAAAAAAAHAQAQQAAAAAQAQAQQQQAAAAAAAVAHAEAQQRAAAAEEEERLRRQQVQDQMQSIHLGNATGPVLSPSSTMYGGGGTGGMAQLQPPYYNTNSSNIPVGFPPPAPQPQGYNINNTNMYSQPQPPPPQQQQQQQYSYQQPQPPMYPPAQQQDGNNNNNMPLPQQQQQQQQQPQHQQQISDMQQQQQQQQPRHYQPTVMGNPTAGMYNGGVNTNNNNNMMYQPQQQLPIPNHQMYMQQQQRTVMTVPMGYYYRILVTEPLLVQSPNHGGGLSIFGIGGSTPHWSYQITTELSNLQQQQQQQATSPSNQSTPPPNTGGGGGVWMVRRRFRHVVALEDRLREDCPGAILPPRPEKHVSRAIEEVGAHQSAEFAMQRALELQNYLNLLIHHPYAQQSPVLRLFLYNQDDLGTTWPEVSNNAFTRLANASVGAAVKVSESTAGTKLPWHDQGMIDDFGEDNAELIALQNGESIRMGAVLQAVPKLEGAATLLREHTELTLSAAMEFSRIAKDLEITDRELYQPIDLVSAGMLRAGRRSKRLVMELSAAVQSYSNQYKLCRYERMAFADRKNAIIRRQKERGRADHRAAQLLFHQRQQHHLSGSQQYYGNNNMNNMDRMAQDAAMMDDFATDVNQECEEIGRRLKQEVNRITWNRKIEWNASVKVIASAMKEAATERVAIWETIRESFVKAYPEYAAPTAAVEPNGVTINPMQQSQQQAVDTTSSFMNNPITPSPLGY